MRQRIDGRRPRMLEGDVIHYPPQELMMTFDCNVDRKGVLSSTTSELGNNSTAGQRRELVVTESYLVAAIDARYEVPRM